MSILNTTRSVTLSTGESVEIRELKAVDGIEFLKLLASKLASIQSGNASEIRVQIQDVVSGAEDVSDFLIHKACGKPRGWMHGLGINDFILVLSDAIELNITETTIKKLMGVAARFGLIKS